MQFSTQAVLGTTLLLAFSSINLILACPQGYGCYRTPAGCGDAGAAACDLLIAWRPEGSGDIAFKMQGTYTGTDKRYLAVGFSADTVMGDDDILICRQSASANTVVLEHYWSIVTPAQNIVQETSATPSEDGLSNITLSDTNGVISCEFIRAVSVSGKDHIFDLAAVTTADSMPMYYYFFGTGPVIDDAAQQHEDDPISSAAGIDYTVAGDITAGEGSDSDSHENAAPYIIASVMLLMLMSWLAVSLN